MHRKLLAGGKSSLRLIAVLFVFSTLYFSSCAKEDVVPEEVADVGDVLGKKGNGLMKDIGGFVCHCYVQILSVSNPPTSFDTGDGWEWRDVTAWK